MDTRNFSLFRRSMGVSVFISLLVLNFLIPLVGNAQVTSPHISLISSQDPAGIKINISGRGFTKGSTATLYTKNPDGSQSVIQYSDTSPDGSFNINHLFPIEYPSGTYLLWITDNTTGIYSNAVDLVIPLADSVQTKTPQPFYIPKHGDLIRTKRDSRIYLVQGQQQYGQSLGYQRRAIANEQVFNQMGFRWSDVKEIDYQDMIILPEGKPIWSKEIIAPFPEGTLIRLKGQTQTYVIQGGRKCYIPDPETFQALGYQWDQVIEVDKATLDSILTGVPIVSVKPRFQYTPPGQAPPVQPPAYSLPPPATSPSYPSPPTWQPSPYGSITTPQSTGPIPYQTQPQSFFPDGTLVRGSGSEIYLMENGVRRLIPDMETFNALSLSLGNVIYADDQELGSIPLGLPIPTKKKAY